MEGAPQTQTKSSEQIKNGNQVSVMSTGTKEEKNTEIAVQPEQEPVPQPKPEPIFMTRFYAKGTKAQLVGLKHYLEKEGIEYGNA